MSSDSLNDRYISCMVLSAIGDAMGYYSGKFEFCMSGLQIHEIVNNDLGGLDKLEISCEYWTLYRCKIKMSLYSWCKLFRFLLIE